MPAATDRLRDFAALLGPAGRGLARLTVDRMLAAPKQVYLGAGLAALVAAIGGNALLMQAGRHPAPLFSRARSPDCGDRGAARRACADGGSGESGPGRSARAGGARHDVLASGPLQDKPRPAPATPPGPEGGERHEAARADQIGALLLGKPVGDESQLVRAAQIALLKLGYPVKPDGAEDGATRRALRKFERAHGLAPTTEIGPALVKQLTAAARAGG